MTRWEDGCEERLRTAQVLSLTHRAGALRQRSARSDKSHTRLDVSRLSLIGGELRRPSTAKRWVGARLNRKTHDGRLCRAP